MNNSVCSLINKRAIKPNERSLMWEHWGHHQTCKEMKPFHQHILGQKYSLMGKLKPLNPKEGGGTFTLFVTKIAFRTDSNSNCNFINIRCGRFDTI